MSNKLLINSSNEPEKAFCFKQHYYNKNRFQKLISEKFQVIMNRIFFEMHNLYIIWLPAFQYLTCKVSANSFTLFYSNRTYVLLFQICFVCYIPNYYIHNCVYLYLVLLTSLPIGTKLLHNGAMCNQCWKKIGFLFKKSKNRIFLI